jgi:hypothetical protein
MTFCSPISVAASDIPKGYSKQSVEVCQGTEDDASPVVDIFTDWKIGDETQSWRAFLVQKYGQDYEFRLHEVTIEDMAEHLTGDRNKGAELSAANGGKRMLSDFWTSGERQDYWFYRKTFGSWLPIEYGKLPRAVSVKRPPQEPVVATPPTPLTPPPPKVDKCSPVAAYMSFIGLETALTALETKLQAAKDAQTANSKTVIQYKPYQTGADGKPKTKNGEWLRVRKSREYLKDGAVTNASSTGAVDRVILDAQAIIDKITDGGDECEKISKVDLDFLLKKLIYVTENLSHYVPGGRRVPGGGDPAPDGPTNTFQGTTNE